MINIDHFSISPQLEPWIASSEIKWNDSKTSIKKNT